MFITRRRFTHLLTGTTAAGALAGLAAPLVRAQGYEDMPNVFYSPHGKPFRAKTGAPYPVADWFTQADKDADGKLDHAEFIADAAAFFAVLDLNGDGVLDPYEISLYEHRVAPEILGYRVNVAAGRSRAGPDGARLWLAQYGGGGGGGSPGQPELGPPEGSIDPGGSRPNEPTRPKEDLELGTGASPFSLLREPEPVTAGDPEFVTRGTVRKAAFLRHADDNFTALDGDGVGYLTLAGLPKTPVQALIEREHHGRRASRR
ncbi:MAG: hypothetical protein ACHP84_01475 [Caulobacterales bacterium]